ncbi:hypothetical protein GYMLUDRAFT_43266 [Collybiopsis luxurians FD-317 M1]|uniref:Thioester reductase (TE) domain-containing protein n=1 Tax=Collybiopsis luxurians FD-317 M1 TaxID=944289 RepID=A0A0D0CY03_9AGAR|nr:hypothetical protein GYMLUDRAFT_43266 [Collybiopsis luxurians FD-317 M1]
MHPMVETASARCEGGGVSLRDHSTASPVREERFSDPAVAIGSGYAESKWVAEQLFYQAATGCGLRNTVVRVGQLCGDTKTGGWGQQEWVPAIVSLSQSVKSVPSRDQHVSWVNVDIAAATLVDIAKSKTEEPVLHLMARSPVSWDTVFRPIAKRLGNLPLVSYEKWLESLETLTSKGETTIKPSAAALLPFFRHAQFGNQIKYDVSKTCQVSTTMAQMEPLSAEDVVKSVDYWEKIGFL